ncbi:unnamed protein product [Periconia digitata]|uniref:Uncharacterized protein n=1 Tax=Periconia digitata TaxID=1303443 RepID=A0A9W4XLU6_9PLEO|nr:unnamed protein product [Periconia digitata]
MLGAEVSGKKKKRDRKIGPFIQSISHIDQRQFSACTLNPEIMGPRAGPVVAAKAHSERTYGSLIRLYMSCRLAPPVAKAGLPKNPWRKRSTTRPAKLSTTDAGIVKMTKMAKEIMYGGFRPMIGISLRGEKRRGPMPYARTYMERPRDAILRVTPNCSMTPGMEGEYMAEPMYTPIV